MKINYGQYFTVNNRIILGFLFIVLAAVIFFTNVIDVFVTSLLWPLLEGSSEGKTVIFLSMIGAIIIIDALMDKKNIASRFYKDDNYYSRYLIVTIVLLILCALFGLFIELYIRYSLNVNPFTILTSMNPYPSTSSPMHSHAYKSVLGIISYYLVPSHMNTGLSILKFVQPYAYVVIPIWITCLITGLLGIHKTTGLTKAIAILSLILALIGLLDGGMFSQPFLIGIGFLLLCYYTKGEKLKVHHFVKPVVIMGYILLIAMICEVGGSNTADHTLTVINQTEPVDMSQYNVTNVVYDNDKITYTISADTPDNKLITDVFDSFKGKCDATFMSWNFYTYFDNPNTKIMKERNNY